jgi:hypothetical protein
MKQKAEKSVENDELEELEFRSTVVELNESNRVMILTDEETEFIENNEIDPESYYDVVTALMLRGKAQALEMLSGLGLEEEKERHIAAFLAGRYKQYA